jgi:hypothetical protein
MSEPDDLFRKGLGSRRPEVTPGMWDKIAARKQAVPEGEAIDRLFAGRLADRKPPVPAGMWSRIVAARRAFPYSRLLVAAGLLLLLSGLSYLFFARMQVLAPTETSVAEVAGTVDGQPALTLPELESHQATAQVEPTETMVLPTRPLTSSPAPVVSPQTAVPVPREPRDRPTSVAGRVPRLPVAPLPLAAAKMPLPSLAAGRSFTGSGRDRLSGELLLGATYAGQQLRVRSE